MTDHDPRTHDIEHAPVNDHQTIERRLSRLENDVCRDANGRPLMSLLVEQMGRISRLEEQAGSPENAMTVNERLTRLEAWTREEIFTRTAMDEPEPEPWGTHMPLSKAIERGIAVPADDPRLQPLVVTEELCRVFVDTIWPHIKESRRRERGVGYSVFPEDVNAGLAAVIAHLNAKRGQP